MTIRTKLWQYILAFGFVVSISTALLGNAHATEIYSPETLEQAELSGHPVLLEFYASWCSTCRSQSKALDSLKSQEDFQDLIVLRADYDNDKELKKRFGVKKQSTLILLKDGKEVARTIGTTRESALAEFLTESM
jgi:thiol-disulfide isomerase/thioredoxin